MRTRSTGGNGGDSLNGGTGADNMSGGDGNDNYQVDEAGDVVTEAVGQGNDIVFSSVSYALSNGSEVESLATSSYTAMTTINLTGNNLNNYMIGNDGKNQIDGKAGADVMVGRAGDDKYLIEDLGDKVFEDANQGYDVIFTAVNHTLANGQEIEGLSSIDWNATYDLNLTGNTGANYLIGNAGANVLDGKAGNDVLQGREGMDTFAFTTALGAGNVDKIFDFAGVDDTIKLATAVFTALGIGPLNPNAFVDGTVAADMDDRIIYNSATGQLYYDHDGLNGDAQVLFATLTGAPPLTAGDFIVG